MHQERQLLEGLSDLSDRRLPGHSQQLVVVLALGEHCQGQCEREDQNEGQLPPTGPLTPGGDHGARHQAFKMVPHLGDASRKHMEVGKCGMRASWTGSRDLEDVFGLSAIH